MKEGGFLKQVQLGREVFSKKGFGKRGAMCKLSIFSMFTFVQGLLFREACHMLTQPGD